MTQESIVLSTTPPFPGADAVAAINKANQAIATDFAGPSDPAALAGPFMTWADTGNMLLKRRNEANTAWVTLGPLLDYMFGRSNILGTVSQSGGVPTGSIIERGSNANGEYVRWADGTQMCARIDLSAVYTLNVASGSLFGQAAGVTYTFPAGFVAGSTVFVKPGALRASLAGGWGTLLATTVTTCEISGISTVSGSQVRLLYTAWGRWF